ncbi:MAG: zinc dependent phospholipase C family protein [Butyrivibrio sp.]|uniref:zinc dependent phospholipase C family protein n=1 Tax=Butyrivibrio sp. TaxID=28121 RepID=UPI003B08B51B|nr:zinc dependent phospholipase C family protein [Butyrivibrio sp.]
MASWMVHLRIADRLLDRIEGLDQSAFILGNIAPDSGVPNEDWSVFTPPGSVTHFRTKPGEKTYIDIDKYVQDYFTKEKVKKYSNREYSFFLGYYTHLLTDIEWTKMTHSEGVSEKMPEKKTCLLQNLSGRTRKTGMTLISFIWSSIQIFVHSIFMRILTISKMNLWTYLPRMPLRTDASTFAAITAVITTVIFIGTTSISPKRGLTDLLTRQKR